MTKGCAYSHEVKSRATRRRTGADAASVVLGALGAVVLLVACATSAPSVARTPSSSPAAPQASLGIATRVSAGASAQAAPGAAQRVWATPLHALQRPFYLAVDGQRNVYVMEEDKSRVTKLDPTGAVVGGWGTAGAGDGQFDCAQHKADNFPCSVAVDSKDRVYVADYGGRVQVFDAAGHPLAKFSAAGPQAGQSAQPVYPQGLAIDGQGDLYLPDLLNDAVIALSSDGTPRTRWGEHGRGKPGQFDKPTGAAVDPQGNVYVADAWNHRVQKFDRNGKYLLEFGGLGGDDGQLGPAQGAGPQDLATDRQGNVYVVDLAGQRIQVFSGEGKFLSTWGSYGDGEMELTNPSGIAVDDEGSVYVSDTDNGRVEKFRPAQ